MSRRTILGALGIAGAASGAWRSLDAADPYDNPRNLYRALADQPAETIALRGGEIRLVFADGAPGVDRSKVRDWVRTAARALTTYFSRFPVLRYGLLVIAEEGDRVGHGTTFGFAGSATRIHVGRDADAAAFRDDWVLVHEMLHASVANLPRRALWLQEGNATWLEPVARAQAGELSPMFVWQQALAGMPKGARHVGEGGMDGTDRWGRLYWGGATFWLEAEIAIFEATGGRAGLIDAMRAISAQSGGNTVIWTPERLMTVGDTACNTSVLAPLYERYAHSATTPDLGRLFARLGVGLSPDGSVRIDPHAELARLTAKLTRAPV